MSAALTLYELAGADADLRFSPHCWKTRMALAHKGLDADRIPWRFSEKPAIAFSGQGLVPVMVDGDHSVADSWRIAEHLEARYPDRPSLFGGAGGRHVARFVNSWADATLIPLVARLCLMDIYACLHEADRAYFRASREARFGMPLEQVVAEPDQAAAAFSAALTPLRLTLKHQPFLGGAEPAYADYCVFGMFMWARCVSAREVLGADDPVMPWREALLDAFDGLARNAPRAACSRDKAALSTELNIII